MVYILDGVYTVSRERIVKVYVIVWFDCAYSRRFEQFVGKRMMPEMVVFVQLSIELEDSEVDQYYS